MVVSPLPRLVVCPDGGEVELCLHLPIFSRFVHATVPQCSRAASAVEKGELGWLLASVYCVAGPFPAGLLFCGQTGGSENPVEQALGVDSFPA